MSVGRAASSPWRLSWLATFTLLASCAKPEPVTCGTELARAFAANDPACDRGDLRACVTRATIYEEDGGYGASNAAATAAILYARACRAGIEAGCNGAARLAGAETCSGEALASCIEGWCERNVVVHRLAPLDARTLRPSDRAELGCRP